MSQERFELHLVPASDDAPPFSAEYQAQLKSFKQQLGPHTQRWFTMDAPDAVGGALGTFIFANGPALLAGAGAIAGAYVTGRMGRKVKLKFGSVEVEAHDPAEVAALLKIATEHAAASAPPVPAPPGADAAPTAPKPDA